MQTATEVIASFQQRGVALTVDGERIRYRAPAGQLTDADRTTLREHKAELVRLLAPTKVAPVVKRTKVPTEHFSREQIPTAPCPGCGGRAWRLRETPKSAGGWLWVCTACADAATAATSTR